MNIEKFTQQLIIADATHHGIRWNINNFGVLVGQARNLAQLVHDSAPKKPAKGRPENAAPPVSVKIDLHWKDKITGEIVHDAIMHVSAPNATFNYHMNNSQAIRHYENIARKIREAIE